MLWLIALGGESAALHRAYGAPQFDQVAWKIPKEVAVSPNSICACAKVEQASQG